MPSLVLIGPAVISAGHRQQTVKQQTDKHIAFYYVDTKTAHVYVKEF